MAGYNVSFKQFSKVLKANRYVLSHYSGSHAIFKNQKGTHITVPIHPNPIVLQRLVKEFELSI